LAEVGGDEGLIEESHVEEANQWGIDTGNEIV
jgi:hypothetical protein